MKKRFLLLIAILSLFVFTGCNQESIKPDDDKPVVDPEPVKVPELEKDPEPAKEEAKEYQNNTFQQVVVSETEENCCKG